LVVDAELLPPEPPVVRVPAEPLRVPPLLVPPSPPVMRLEPPLPPEVPSSDPQLTKESPATKKRPATDHAFVAFIEPKPPKNGSLTSLQADE
jgi:hypothetical protein